MFFFISKLKKNERNYHAQTAKFECREIFFTNISYKYYCKKHVLILKAPWPIATYLFTCISLNHAHFSRHFAKQTFFIFTFRTFWLIEHDMKEGCFWQHKLGLQETNYTKYIFCLQDKLAKKTFKSFLCRVSWTK
jgi:hypothetical protein